MAHQSTGYVMNAEVGQPHGVAPLDDKGKLLSDQLPPITAASVGAEPAGAVSNHLTNAPHLTNSQVALIAQNAIETLKTQVNPFPQYSFNGHTHNQYALANHIHDLATTTTAGFISSSEKAKLGNISGLFYGVSGDSGIQYARSLTEQVKFRSANSGLKISAGHDVDNGINLLFELKALNSRSATPPAYPAISDTWEELDSNGFLINRWFWNGTYWLSAQVFSKEASLVNIGASVQAYYEIPSDANIFVISFKPNVLLGTTNTTNSHWSFTLNRTGSSTVALANTSTANAAPNIWFTQNVAVGIHINITSTGSKAFRFDISKNGVASNIVGSVAVTYRLARI